MKPTTAQAALAAALELDGLTPYTAAREAERLLVFLGDAGWMVAPKVSLPESAPSRGPRTSDTAAESIEDLSYRQHSVWLRLSFSGPMTDEELVAAYEAGAHPRQTPQSIRTRRCELVRAGHVINTGLTRPTKTGRPAIVWQAVGSAQSVAA